MNSFLSRAPWIMDFVALGMMLIVPLLFYSIYIVRIKKNFLFHKKFQIVMSFILLLVILAFELSVRLYGWDHQAQPSAYYSTAVYPSLYIHIFFASLAFCFWFFNIWFSLKKTQALPGVDSSFHKKIGWLTAGFMTLTSVTGWIFYYLAFVA